MLPLSRFTSFINEQFLFDTSNRILLAVSGGKDSVLMAHLFNEAGLKFGIAHCNFCLRNTESDADEDFAEDLAKQIGVAFYATRFNTTAYAAEKKISIQMAARDLRYAWLEEIRAAFAYHFIALAHHQNDVIETVLLNLTRGTGISGLHGILPKRNFLVRPMLFLSRDEIDLLIRSENIRYREDSSNLSTKYARNKIRQGVIPVLKELNAQLEQTFEANTRHFAELEEFLNTHINTLRKRLFCTKDADCYEIAIEEIRELQPQKLVLFELFKPFGFTEAVINDLVSAFGKHPGRIFESSTHQLLLDRGKLVLSPRNGENIPETIIEESTGQVVWTDHLFKCSEAIVNEVEINRDPAFAYIDSEKLQFPLTIRCWQTGDIFYPLGMKGKKKLSDFFIGQKIQLTRKQAVPVVCNGNGDIVWVAGYRLDDRYKLTGQTKKVTIFELKKHHG